MNSDLHTYEKKEIAGEKAFIWCGAIAGWFSLILQLYLILENRRLSIPATLVQFFSYFTILTNILVALACTFKLMPKSRYTPFFAKPKIMTAITVYIFIVGLVYNLILRQLWSPTGAQKLVDELLHTVIPLISLLYWLLFVSKQTLQWKNVLPWMWYPFLYLIYILIRGAITDLYPYPFMEVNTLGYTKVIINSILLTVTFLFFSLLFIGIAKILSRNRTGQ